MNPAHVVGGGLAGSEAAWQLAERGVPVKLIEMRPAVSTGAHRTGKLAEVVCTNSLKSTLMETASGLLKAEMDILGCRLLGVARNASVPAGHALAVDRDVFSSLVTGSIETHPRIEVVRACQEDLDVPVPAIVATGPLTAKGLSTALQAHCSSDHLYFYDAIAPSIEGESIDADVGFWASRYGKGEADYLNIPLGKEDYLSLIERIRRADLVGAHAFEEEKYYEACLPIEVMVARGADTARFGPLKPRGLIDPRMGREPYAAVQLRQESRGGSLLGLVGFQTRMTYAAQKDVIRSIPGLETARILRFGSIHRNMFLNIPEICEPYQQDRRREGLFYAGQICGVEGYVESINSGLISALGLFAAISGRKLPPFPEETMTGSLMRYIHTASDHFQPMNANMGLIPATGRPRVGRRERYRWIAKHAVAAMNAYRETNAWLFETRSPGS